MENKNNLVDELERVIKENEFLKIKNAELSKKVGELRNWTGIREGEIMPRLRERYGEVGCLHIDITTPLSNIVRSLLNIKKVTEINETNYELAKEITIDLVDTICKYEWLHYQETKSHWDNIHIRCK